jgi:hypothetical protein
MGIARRAVRALLQCFESPAVEAVVPQNLIRMNSLVISKVSL